MSVFVSGGEDAGDESEDPCCRLALEEPLQALAGNQLVISEVIIGSAAGEIMPPLLPGDGIVSIDKKPAAPAPVTAATGSEPTPPPAA